MKMIVWGKKSLSVLFSNYVYYLLNKNNNSDDGGNDNKNSPCKLLPALNMTVIFKVFCC